MPPSRALPRFRPARGMVEGAGSAGRVESRQLASATSEGSSAVCLGPCGGSCSLLLDWRRAIVDRSGGSPARRRLPARPEPPATHSGGPACEDPAESACFGCFHVRLDGDPHNRCCWSSWIHLRSGQLRRSRRRRGRRCWSRCRPNGSTTSWNSRHSSTSDAGLLAALCSERAGIEGAGAGLTLAGGAAGTSDPAMSASVG